MRDDGHFDCALWPATFTWRSATYSGRIPTGTVAVMHTHPTGQPQPSDHDFQEAKRIAVPVIVVCRKSVIMALPFGKNSAGASNVYTSALDETAPDSLAHARQTHPVSH